MIAYFRVQFSWGWSTAAEKEEEEEALGGRTGSLHLFFLSSFLLFSVEEKKKENASYSHVSVRNTTG